MFPVIELFRELLTHPTLREFIAWLVNHADVLSYLFAHPLVMAFVRQYFFG